MLIPQPPEILTEIDNYILNVVNHVDLFANTWYADTPARRSSGIDFTQPVADSSLVLVTLMSPPKPEISFSSFLLPFENRLWGAIFVVIFLTGFMFWVFEPVDGNYNIPSILRSVYTSFGNFAGADGLETNTRVPTMMFLAYSFFLIIVLASYTANLASMLVTATVETTPVQSIQDANNIGASICVLHTFTAAATVLSTSYPNVKIVRVTGTTNIPLYAALRAGTCSGAVVATADYDYSLVWTETNPTCKMTRVGGVFRSIQGSWAFKTDFQKTCSYVLQAVLDEIIVGMKGDGSYDAILQNSLGTFGDTGLACREL